jgi:tetratricopeptide (TPR) repeat protein
MTETEPAGTAQIIRGIVVLVLAIASVLWLMYRSLKRSEEPAGLVVKWLITAPILWIFATRILPSGAAGGLAALGALVYALLCAVVLLLIWRQSIASVVARPFGDLYDGGDREIEARPFYSVAQGKRKRGNYAGAIADIRAQLEKFPNDFEGQILLAGIQAENLNDLPGAEVAIQRICQQPDHPQRSIAYALNLLADWHLKLSQDRDAARRALEQITTMMPDSELSALAAQRIGHLAGTEQLLGYHDRKKIAIKTTVENAGLLPAESQPKAPEVDLAKQTAEYVKHLAEHPLDTEAREKLAVLYADHYRRLDLAADQLEQLIAHPNQPARRVTHWLNLLADLQVRHGAEYEKVRQTVQRIVDLFPGSAAAEIAGNRLNLLKLELKGQNQGQTVKMGSYEQDIGLKRGLPNKL